MSHTIQKYYGENGEGGCDDVLNGSGESYIAIYKMSCNFMLEIKCAAMVKKTSH